MPWSGKRKMSQDAMVSEVLVVFDCFVKDVQGGRNHFGICYFHLLGNIRNPILFPDSGKSRCSVRFQRRVPVLIIAKIIPENIKEDFTRLINGEQKIQCSVRKVEAEAWSCE